MNQRQKKIGCLSAVLLLAVAMLALPQFAAAQDDQDDPPGRVARLGYLQGSVAMQPAGESEWVGAVSNRPMTTGDKLWADQDSRAEVELGSAVVRLSANTGFSFLNLDDRTVQIELTAGSLSIRVRQLNQDDLFEIDTPNQAFSVFRPGNYRVEASEDGNYTVVSVRDGEGESTGNGQTYTLHAGQKGTFSGTDSLNADVVQIGGPDQFDNWSSTRDRRYDDSRSASYVSRDVVGYEDLDEYGDWRDDSNYGHVWYPSRVESGWAPYRDGHWDWIPPWGWTWVDDAPWGYAPFHYGRWVTVGGRWGWIAGPVAVRPVYAPALVVFIGGGGGFGGNVGWFPLGPREVYVPSYPVSRGYVERVNVSNTTVNVTNITNVYNTTIVNKTTNVTNVNYVNRNVQGAVTAVPQRTFVSAQPVNRARVSVNARDISSAPMTTRVAVAPTRESVLGGRANTANRVTAPPPAVRNRTVIAKHTPPPPPVPFARQQQALAQHPGQPLARHEVQNLRPAGEPQAHPMVKMAPPGKPATPNAGRPGNQPNQPGNQPRNERADQPGTPSANRPNAPSGQPAPGSTNNPSANRPGNERAPNERPAPPNNRPDSNRPGEKPVKNDRTPGDQPDNRPNANQPNNRPDTNRPAEKPAKNDRPPADQPDNHPNANQPDNRPNANQPNNRPDTNRPAEKPAKNDRAPADQPDNRPNANQPNNRPDTNRPSEKPVRNDRAPADQPDNRPNANQPNNRPDTNRPAEKPAKNDRTPADQPDNRPNANQPNNRPDTNRPGEKPVKNDRAPADQPDNRPDTNRPNNHPDTNRPPAAERNQPNNRPEPSPNRPAPRPDTSAPSDRPPHPATPPDNQAAPDRKGSQSNPQTPEEKKQEQERRKREQQKQQQEKPPNS
jgi:hypothetical protein